MAGSITCGICDKQNDDELLSFSFDSLVTSDCVPFSGRYELFSCVGCGVMQVANTQRYGRDVRSIYKNYRMFHQGDGKEQKIVSNGSLNRRSYSLVEYLENSGLLVSGMKVLDVGCGNGDFLRAISDTGNYTLDGFEYDESTLDLLVDIPGFRSLSYGSLEKIVESYDLIVMVHSLEHFFFPQEVLQTLKRILNKNGKLVLQLPNSLENPFDFIIFDHVFHFTPASLASVAMTAGLSVERLSTEVAAREISMILSQNAHSPSIKQQFVENGGKIISYAMQWFDEFLYDVGEALRHKKDEGVVIFGTSIGAVWLNSVFPQDVDYFVDEDLSRVGKALFGKEVHALKDLPDRTILLVPVAPIVADKIRERLLDKDIQVVVPPHYQPR